MTPLRCLSCGAVFRAESFAQMQADVASHQRLAAHPNLALGRVR